MKITERQAYRYSLFIPLVLPIVLVVLWLIGIRSLPTALQDVGFFFFLLVMAAYVGGIPYLILCVGILWWSRNRSTTTLRNTILCSPFLLIPFGYVYLITVEVLDSERMQLTGTIGLSERLFDVQMLTTSTIFSLGFGYTYIIVIIPVIWLIKKLGVLE